MRFWVQLPGSTPRLPSADTGCRGPRGSAPPPGPVSAPPPHLSRGSHRGSGARSAHGQESCLQGLASSGPGSRSPWTLLQCSGLLRSTRVRKRPRPPRALFVGSLRVPGTAGLSSRAPREKVATVRDTAQADGRGPRAAVHPHWGREPGTGRTGRG